MSQTQMTVRTVVTNLTDWASVSFSVNRTGSMSYGHPCSSKTTLCLFPNLLHCVQTPSNPWGGYQTRSTGVIEMSQEGKVLVTKADDRRVIPRTHIVRREPTPLTCSLTSTHLLWCVPLMVTINKWIHVIGNNFFLRSREFQLGVLGFLLPAGCSAANLGYILRPLLSRRGSFQKSLQWQVE